MKPRLILVVMLSLASFSFTTAVAEESATTDLVTVADAVAPSLVRVELTPQYCAGEPPSGVGWISRCPNCGAYHGGGQLQQVTEEERPAEIAGFLLSPTKVVTTDPLVHNRFVKSVNVRFGNQVVAAHPVAYALAQNAIILELEKPLEKAKPLAFDSKRNAPYFAVKYARLNGAWAVSVAPLTNIYSVSEAGRRFFAAPASCLITDGAGAPVGVSMNGELPPDDSWKGTPLDWKTVSKEEMQKLLSDLAERTRKGLLQVTLLFRSPKSTGEPYSRFRFRGRSDEIAEQNVPGILVDEKRVLVLANMKADMTGRLQKISVQLPAAGADKEGASCPAKFLCSLADYGCFVAELENPQAGLEPLKLSSSNIVDFVNRPLLAEEIALQGKSCTSYYLHYRIPAVVTGWRGKNFPEYPSNRERYVFLFDLDGSLVVIPLAVREKASTRERYYSYQRGEQLNFPVAYLREEIAAPEKFAQPQNVPVGEDQENRIAWLGVVLQAMNKDIARANSVSHLTRDGECGALVVYVYDGSPAAKAGIKPGMVLLRMNVEGLSKPLEIMIRDNDYERQFPWDALDRLHEQYFDSLPRPWQSVSDSITETLTEIGFGKKIQLEIIDNGKPVQKDLEVVESPPHYDSAPSYKSKPLGMTVRDITFEVRRYFQMKPDAPGVIISKLEPGQKAAVGGIKPYEIITQVNGVPVKNVKEFAAATEGQDEIKFSVRRMTRERQVTVRLGNGRPAITTEPATSGP